MRKFFLILLVGLTTTSHGQNAYQQEEKNVKAIIQQLNKDMEKAFNENDMPKVAAFYSDDSEIAGEGYVVRGRKDLDAYWNALKDRGRGWKLEVTEIIGTGEFVSQLGKSDLNFIRRGELANATTNFVVIWRKQADGSYKIFRDYITNTQFALPKK